MNAAVLIVFGFALVWVQDTDEARRVIAIIKAHDGTVVIDDKAPGKPVIAINL